MALSSGFPPSMAKRNISPFVEPCSIDAGRRGRPETHPKPFPTAPPLTSRPSVLTSVVPYLRQDMPVHHKLPLLTLELSSSSFLDSVITNLSLGQPAYTIKTIGVSTTISRANSQNEYVEAADIKWPKITETKGKGNSDRIVIRMGSARWKGGETLLKPGTLLSSPRKFSLPNFSHHLKWRRVGTSYWCTTTTVKGPIAIFDPASGPLRPKFKIFESLHDKHDSRARHVYSKVSLVLLDYLLVTCLLLVTDAREWESMKKFEGKDVFIPPVDTDIIDIVHPKSAPSAIPTLPQWRKIMFGEPLYPKRSSLSTTALTLPTPQAVVVSSLTSTNQMDRIIYGESLEPTPSAPLGQIPSRSSDRNTDTSSPDLSTSGSDDEDDELFFSPLHTRPSSPSAESIFYPLTNASAPSHTYIDPLFYNEYVVPPVPPIPPQYCRPSSSRAHSRSRPSSTNSTASYKQPRELPIPPSSLPIEPIPRPRSTPPRAMSSLGTASSLPANRRLPESRANSIRRPLPQLPRSPSLSLTVGTAQQVLSHGRARSHSAHPTEKWHHQHGARSLPPPPPPLPVSTDNVPLHHSAELRHHTHKETGDDLAEWVHALTSPPGHSPVPLSSTTFDPPPPAYTSINNSL